MSNKHKKLSSIIRSKGLKPLIDRANKVEIANKRLKRFLPSPLSEHVSICNIKDNSLILKTNSPAWSTRTNFMATQIINYMRNEGGLAMVKRLKIKVIPDQTQNIAQTRSVDPLSKSSSSLLNSVADDLQEASLAKVLRQIAKHGQG